ncbi:MAG: DUF4389 domain-containing protein [Alphaproteobacteria bacterium]
MSDTHPTGRSATTIGSEDRWLRLLYMVIFAIITYSLLWLILFLAAVQFLLAWINGQPNDNLRDFTVKLDAYFRDCLDFLGYASAVVPFPFSPFASAGGAPAPVKPAAKAKRRSRKQKPPPTESPADETAPLEDD